MSEQQEGDFQGNHPCIDCDSTDAMAVYLKEDGSYNGFCRGLGCNEEERYKSNNDLAKSAIGQEMGIERKSRRASRKGKSEGGVSREERKVSKKKRSKQAPITKEQRDRVHKNSTEKGNMFRGIMDEYLKHFGIRTEYDGNGDVSRRYYPIVEGKTSSGQPHLVGYKIRTVPDKNFPLEGKNGKGCELLGQWRGKGGKYLLIVGGEEDAPAAYQMLREDQKRRKKLDYRAVDVVSPTVGETSAASQCKEQYDFLDSYDNIIVCMDDDEAGEKATQSLLTVLPSGKVKVMTAPANDPNKSLEDGLQMEFVSSFYNAKKPKIAGIVSGMEMWDSMVESVSMPLIPLPPELKPLQDKLCGGLPVGEIINILAASGVGKTTITNVLELYWIFYAPYKVGILSLEAGAGKFLTRLVSGYLKQNVARLETPEAKLEFLEANKEACIDLFMDEEEEARFCLVDDKGELDTLAEAKRTIEKMIRQGGCDIIIIDPIQDLLDALSTEEQAAFVGWQKKIKGRDGTTFINVNHTRKSGGGKKAGSQGGELTEEDMQGTSALYKSGAVNIIISRDKTAESIEDRNTTKVMVPKSRDAGDTGPAGELYYELETATLHNKEDWLRENNRGF